MFNTIYILNTKELHQYYEKLVLYFIDCKANCFLKQDNNLLNNLLSIYCIKKCTDIHICDLKIIRNKAGKPLIDFNDNIHFSLSHTKNMITCIISEKNIGIDIEYIKSFNLDNKMSFLFSKDEWDHITSSNEKSNSFFEIWTLKECFVKFLGLGLNKPFSHFNIKKEQEKYILYEKNKKIENIHLTSFEFDSNYRISVCSMEENIKKKVNTLNISNLLEPLIECKLF